MPFLSNCRKTYGFTVIILFTFYARLICKTNFINIFKLRCFPLGHQCIPKCLNVKFYHLQDFLTFKDFLVKCKKLQDKHKY